jgi:hypothetical protein
MKQAYDCFTKSGGLFFGILLVGEDVDIEGMFRPDGFDVDRGGVFHVVLIYFPEEGGTALKEFYSEKSADDTVSKADAWIKANLYPDFVRGPARSLGSHVV